MTHQEALRRKLNEHVEASGETLYQVGKECGILKQSLYPFSRGKIKQLDGENTIKLMRYLGLHPTNL